MDLAPFNPRDYDALDKNKTPRSELKGMLDGTKDRYGDILPNPATRYTKAFFPHVYIYIYGVNRSLHHI